MTGVTGTSGALQVCHIMTADLWAGAEVQVATVASYLSQRPEVGLTVVLLNEGRLANELRRLGVRVVVIDERETGALGILAFLIRFLRENRFDIVHTHRYKDTVLGAIAARIASVPHVIRTVHGLNEAMRGWEGAKLRVYEALDRAVLRRFVDRIIAVSGRIAETLAQSGCPTSTIVSIRNGVDLDRIVPTRGRDDVRCELGLRPDTTVIGTAGRLSPVKGHIHLLRAARLVLQSKPAARFLIVGGGPLHDQLTAAARDLGVDGACLFAGARSDVHDLVAAMDVFVLPSLDEGIPLALLEAMALERPVVATAVGGVPEVVSSGADGLLVPAADDRALADAILELAADPGLAERLGARARQVIAERFCSTRNGDALMDVYRQVAFGPVASNARRQADPTVGAILSRLCRGVAYRTQQKVARALTRRRMRRIRRNPAILVSRLRAAKSILVVCQGNIIRSPFATSFIRREMNGDAPVSISSAGLQAVPGKPSHPTAVIIAAAMEIDLRDHAAAPITADAVATADVVFVMDIPQVAAMAERFPGAREKTFLLTCLAPDAPLEIADPYAGDESQFHACYDHICRSVRPVIRALSQDVPRAHIVDPPLLAIEHGGA